MYVCMRCGRERHPDAAQEEQCAIFVFSTTKQIKCARKSTELCPEQVQRPPMRPALVEHSAVPPMYGAFSGATAFPHRCAGKAEFTPHVVEDPAQVIISGMHTDLRCMVSN